MHAFELGCDRTWRKAHWRTSHGITAEAPCLGILSDGRATKPASVYPTIHLGTSNVSRLAMLEPIIQELRWMIPGLGLGVLTTGCPAESPPSIPCQSLPFFVTATATNPSETLNWICGVDVWLIASQLPIASSLAELADHLRIPYMRFAGKASSGEFATELSHCFEVSRARLPMLAFRSPPKSVDSNSHFSNRDSVITADSALETLGIALNHSQERGVSLGLSIKQDSLRPAA
jgi:hypothetical protein